MIDEKSKGGRPTGYREEYAAVARKICELGGVNEDVAEALGTTSRTVQRWAVQYPELSEAMDVGGAVPNRLVKRSLYHKALGFYYVEQQAVKVKRGKTADGEDLGEEVVVVEVEKYSPPDTIAAKFWLVNKDRDPETGEYVWREKMALTGGGEGDAPIASKLTVEFVG